MAAVIELKKDNPEQHQSITLLHEIVHAILWQADRDRFDLEEDAEEKVADAIAKGLYQMVKDNGTDFLSYSESKGRV